MLFSEHHLSHAASAFYPSPFENSAILTLDGVGEWTTTSVSIGSGCNLDLVKEIHFPHSLGLLYSAFTYYTGFKVNSGEYKLMGLAPYGSPKYVDKILDNLIPDPKKNNPRIGDLNAKGTEKVTGFVWVEETKECVIQWASTSAVEKYLPSINTVSTTFGITVVATTAATLTPLLNRVLKPLFKQLIGRIKKLFGKKGTKFTGKKPIKSKLT